MTFLEIWKEVRRKPWSLEPQYVLIRLPHSSYRSKGPASTKHHRINIWELILTQHWHWMVNSIQKLSSRLQLLSKLRWNLNVKAAKMIYTNIVILVFTYSGTVNLNLSGNVTRKTWLNSWTRCWYHHQNQYSEVNTNNDLRKTSCLPDRQSIYHKAATSTYD